MKRSVHEATQDAEDFYALLDGLVAARVGSGLTQTEVARRMGVRQPTVSAFEADDSNPRLETLQRYARAVRCRIEFRVTPRGQASATHRASHVAATSAATGWARQGSSYHGVRWAQ